MSFTKKIGIVPQGGVPCKDCERKGCGAYHDSCKKYQEYRAKIDTVHAKYRADNDKMARPDRADSGRTAPMAITRTHRR